MQGNKTIAWMKLVGCDDRFTIDPFWPDWSEKWTVLLPCSNVPSTPEHLEAKPQTVPPAFQLQGCDARQWVISASFHPPECRTFVVLVQRRSK